LGCPKSWNAGNLETRKSGIPETKAWNPKTRNDYICDLSVSHTQIIYLPKPKAEVNKSRHHVLR